MAEYVNQTLEEMLPEVEEMNQLGLFTKKETKIILKNREAMEYKLRQLTKTKVSYLNYITYEKKLLELLKFRRKKTASDSKKREIEKSIADRIHNLYRLAAVRFKEDVSLWTQHIQFSKDLKENAYVTRLYEKALKIHSHNEDLWVEAAQWESSKEGNNNHELAREILLKAQRVNPESEVILLEIFRMELNMAKQVLQRKSVLGIKRNKASKGDREKEKEDDEGKDVTELKLAEIIYTKGIEMMHGNSEFHLKMLKICSNFQEAKPVEKLIISDLRRLYPQDALVWNGLALMHLQSYEKMDPVQRSVAIKRCLEVFGEGIKQAPTAAMWSYCLRAHLNILGMKEVSLKQKDEVLHSALSSFQAALGSSTTLQEDLYVSMLSLLQDLDLHEDVEAVAERGSQEHPASATIWLARLRAMAVGGAKEEVLSRTLRSALVNIPGKEAWSLWSFLLTLYASKKSEALEDLMERACRCSNPHVCRPAKEWCLSWTLRQGGIKKARMVYNHLKIMQPISIEFFRTYIQAEVSQPEPNLTLVRAAFEESIVEFGVDEPDVWLNFMEMEKVVAKNAARSGVIHQRALVGLDASRREDFVRKLCMLGMVG